jgi:hypothetical protein
MATVKGTLRVSNWGARCVTVSEFAGATNNSLTGSFTPRYLHFTIP